MRRFPYSERQKPGTSLHPGLAYEYHFLKAEAQRARILYIQLKSNLKDLKTLQNLLSSRTQKQPHWPGRIQVLSKRYPKLIVFSLCRFQLK